MTSHRSAKAKPPAHFLGRGLGYEDTCYGSKLKRRKQGPHLDGEPYPFTISDSRRNNVAANTMASTTNKPVLPIAPSTAPHCVTP